MTKQKSRAQPSPDPAASKSGDTSRAPAPEGNAAAGRLDPGLYGAGLYVVSTPIGNLDDMTARAVATLRAATVIACEDTRVTAVLLRRFGITTPMTPYHDHNAARVRPQLIARLKAGEIVALVSDAGTPLLSDPGYKLVQACTEEGVTVVPVPGASAVLAALVTAALPTDRVLFAGFLPPKSAARKTDLADLRSLAATLVFYESAQRLPETLADMALVLGMRRAAVCRELTKRFEEIRRDTLEALAAHYAEAGSPRGEIVIVVEGASGAAPTVSDEDIDAALSRALAAHSVRDAAALVALELGQPKRAMYARALALAPAKDR